MKVHFLLRELLDGYEFRNLHQDGIKFSDPKAGIDIEIRPDGEETDSRLSRRHLELRAKISYSLTERQFNFIDALISDRIIDPNATPIALPYVGQHGELVASDGKIKKGYSPTADFLPRDLQELCISAGSDLEKQAIRFIQLLR